MFTRTMTKICPYCAEEIQEAAVKCKHCSSWLQGHPESFSSHGGNGKFAGFGSKSRLTRSTTDVKMSGVCAGIAQYFGLDPTVVRVAYALVTFFTAVAPGFAVYIILACVIPKDDAPVDDAHV